MLTTESTQAKGLELSLYLAPATKPEVRRWGLKRGVNHCLGNMPATLSLCPLVWHVPIYISWLRPLVPPVDSSLPIVCSGQGRGQVSPLWSALEFVPGFTHNR